MKLYRYRKPNLHSVEELFSNTVQFTKYSKFQKLGELDYFTNKKLLSFEESDQAIEHLTEIVKNNVLTNYYMACFSTKGPFDKNSPRIQYSGKNGFCIEYDLDSLNDYIHLAYRKYSYLLQIGKVKYSSKKYDLSPIVNEMYKAVQDSGAQTGPEKEKVLESLIESGSVNENAQECVINSFYQKKLAYRTDSEYRIVLQKPNDEREFVLLKGFIVRPIHIYISTNIPLLILQKIIYYCKTQFIGWEYI